jgi:hypothetical protein
VISHLLSLTALTSMIEELTASLYPRAFSGTNPRNAAQPQVDERVGLFSAVEILPCRKSITQDNLSGQSARGRMRDAPLSHKFHIASSGSAILMPLVWCDSRDPLERPREVALICKACCQSHHGKALSFHQQ